MNSRLQTKTEGNVSSVRNSRNNELQQVKLSDWRWYKWYNLGGLPDVVASILTLKENKFWHFVLTSRDWHNDFYSICRFCLNVATLKWRVSNEKIVIRIIVIFKFHSRLFNVIHTKTFYGLSFLFTFIRTLKMIRWKPRYQEDF